MINGASSPDRLGAIEEKLDQLLALAAMPEQRFLTVNQAATFAGLSPESVRRLLAGGRLTALRPLPGRVTVDRRELESYILSCSRRPVAGRGRRTA